MQNHWASFGIGVVTGMRSMTAGAALIWAAAFKRTRVDWLPSSREACILATAAALGEMAGDKMPFAPDRRISLSVLVRLAIGATGGVALAGREASPLGAALSGMAGAVAGTLLGRAARGATTRSRADWTRALTEDIMAASLATALVRSAEHRGRAQQS